MIKLRAEWFHWNMGGEPGGFLLRCCYIPKKSWQGYIWMPLTTAPNTPSIAINSTRVAFLIINSWRMECSQLCMPKEKDTCD